MKDNAEAWEWSTIADRFLEEIGRHHRRKRIKPRDRLLVVAICKLCEREKKSQNNFLLHKEYIISHEYINTLYIIHEQKSLYIQRK